ncbi:hypothetical protein [Candidatus Rariloculus sp.]|uniref:hypothetical protein n=1 Tax=Candidatus Rariloculus sp. TaxID=3101265 RepID=UPI003D0F1535
MATFDSLRIVKDLQAAGFAQNQAEAVATAIRTGHGDVAKKSEFSGLRSEFSGLRAEFVGMRSELAGVRSELVAVKWAVGLLAALNMSTLAAVVGQLLSA